MAISAKQQKRITDLVNAITGMRDDIDNASKIFCEYVDKLAVEMGSNLDT